MKTKLIRVERWDIERGRLRVGPGSVCSTCPVALAAQRAFRDPTIRMGMTSLDINDERIKVPASVTNWINRFDCKLPVEPFTFEVEY
jgi:hypothetical protein